MRKMMYGLFAAALIGSAGAQEQEPADKVKVSLEFSGSLVSVNTEGVIDSMADAGFETDPGFNGDETKLEFAYEADLWGATAALGFNNEALRLLLVDRDWANPLFISDLFAWVKPFGEHFKFTGGIFENTDSIADYTDDIDDFSMGVFIGDGGDPFIEPDHLTNPALTNGFLAEASVGPLTAQVLLAPNYSKESASSVYSGWSGSSLEASDRLFRIGGRIIGAIEGFGSISGMFKTFQQPIEVANAEFEVDLTTDPSLPGSKVNFMTFGAYFDITAVENLGISLGYTGFLPANDGDDVENVLWNGIDLRAQFTGIEGLSLSTHHNISFAAGAEKDWAGALGKDASFFNLYNAIGGTKTLTERFSLNAEVGNVLSVTDYGDAGKIEYDQFFVGAKLITKVVENVEFKFGLNVNVISDSRTGVFGEVDDFVTYFSLPVTIKVSF